MAKDPLALGTYADAMQAHRLPAAGYALAGDVLENDVLGAVRVSLGQARRRKLEVVCLQLDIRDTRLERAQRNLDSVFQGG